MNLVWTAVSTNHYCVLVVGFFGTQNPSHVTPLPQTFFWLQTTQNLSLRIWKIEIHIPTMQKTTLYHCERLPLLRMKICEVLWEASPSPQSFHALAKYASYRWWGTFRRRGSLSLRNFPSPAMFFTNYSTHPP